MIRSILLYFVGVLSFLKSICALFAFEENVLRCSDKLIRAKLKQVYFLFTSFPDQSHTTLGKTAHWWNFLIEKILSVSNNFIPI